MRKALLLLTLFSAASSAQADVITQWNDVLIGALRTGDPAMAGPGWASRNSAMVHGAMFDAVNAVDRTHTPFKIDMTAAPGTSKDAAAAQAAHTVLSALYPSQQGSFNAALTQSLASVSDGPGKTQGLSLGMTIGQQLLAARANDHATDIVPYTPLNQVGHWRPMPPLNIPALGPGWGLVTPFAMSGGAQFHPPAPPALTSQAYANSYNDVKTLGAKNSAVRTQEQTDIGIFWGYDRPGTGTPPVLYNQITRKIADMAGNSMEENARLFALINATQADAGIASWECKYVYDFWRPIEAIRDGELDGNSLTIGDLNWEPLGAPGGPIPGGGTIESFTPPFPAYVSGHATFGAATMTALANFYGSDNIVQLFGQPLVLHSDEMAANYTRTFTSFEQMSVENARSRIYLGIHWDFDDMQGRLLGDQVADHVIATMMTPIPEPSSIALAAFGVAIVMWRVRGRRTTGRVR